ncbi:cell wall hydrolase [Streptococcus suis]|uniref:GBS Bsp-like repeat-containing protein n=7 Tax=Streptococcus suis TaxID=1307 RepID=UPI00077C1A8B|nr:GBS Bsp-like repeat-containing protein [Streptococcus suis]NQH63880.1 cell wall hydrolase [Streptococcus suis]
MFVKKVVIFLLFFFVLLSSERPIQADTLNAPFSQVSSSQVAETGGQLSVVDEAGQIKAILSNIQGEIIGVTAQFSSETNSGITVTFSMDEQGRYVAILDRSTFAEEDQVFSLKLIAQLTDGSFQTLSDYSFEWKKDTVSAAEKPTALNNSNAISSKIEEEATSTTTSSTVNSSLTTGATSSASNSLTRSSSNTIAGSSNGSTSAPSARVSTASKVSGTITVTNVNASSGTFDVIISNVVGSSSVQTVLVPIWSDINGQDDLRWYSATRQSNGTYKVSVNKKDHKDSTGQYHIHLYYQYSSGRGPIVDGILFELPRVSNSPIVQIQNIDSDLGSFEVNISQVAMVSQDQKILVPIWSDINGQDDLRWYSATRQSDGTYKVSVNKKDHKYSIGKYHIHVYYDSYGSKNIVATTAVNLPSSRSYTVYIDPGHGGRDSGASYGGVHEKNLALSVSNKLRDNLVQRGINVLMTRDGDYDVDFKTERSRMTNESNADLFISIHFNATGAGVSNSSGIETYWYQYDPEYQPKINKEMHNNPTRLAESEILANKVQESLIKETGAVNRGVRRETFAVLRETAIPAILVELGFMDNPSELQVIKQDSYHTRLAKALAQGVMNWYGAVEGK